MSANSTNTVAPHQQWHQMQAFIDSQKPLLLIIGEKNTGKTQLIKKILHSELIQAAPLNLQGDKSITPRHILNQICQLLQLPSPDRSLRFEDQLQRFLDQFDNTKKCLLIIDDAHRIPLSSLAALSHLALLQEEKKPCLQMILSGTLELSERMNCIVTRSIPQVHLSQESQKTAQRYLQTLQLKQSQHQHQPQNTNIVARASYSIASLWQQHTVKALSLLTMGIIAGTTLYSPAPHMPAKTFTTLAKAKAKQLTTPPRYEIVLADNKVARPLNQLIHQFHLKKATLRKDPSQHHYHIHLGHFSSYQAAQQFLKKLPSPLQQQHPHVHRRLS